ncbi:MAG: glycosyltransferase [Planctomycetes bacterium]|nr:glycosyltransferase [Planctomycetota bacterium]
MTTKETNNSASKPLVSVIMNCFNSAKYLKEAIDSIYAQTYKNWEIIFWDNASTDGSGEIARSYNDKLRYFKGERTIPLGAARNKAIEKVQGQFIAFLDCDDLWLPHKLDTQIHHFNNNSNLGFLYSNAYVMQDEKQRLVYSMRTKMPQGSVFRTFLTHYPVNLQTVILRKSLLNDMDHWFDKKLDLSEEYDFFLRLLYKTQAGYQKEPLVVYRLHPNMSTVKKFHKIEEECLCILDKLHNSIPKFEETYRDEIRLFRSRIASVMATEYILRGEKSKARGVLRSYLFVSTKYFVLYLMTYMPVLLYVWLHEKKGGIILRQRLRYLHSKKLSGNDCQ